MQKSQYIRAKCAVYFFKMPMGQPLEHTYPNMELFR